MYLYLYLCCILICVILGGNVRVQFVFFCVDFLRDFDSCQAKVGMLDCWKKENTLNIDLSESESWCEFQTVKACQPNSRLQQIH